MPADFASALRQLLRKPAIALVATLSLALGTGATAAILSCLDAFYLRPLPVPQSHQLVRLFGATAHDAFGGISYPEYRQIQAQTRSLASVGVAQRRGATWMAPGEPRDALIYVVSPDFFQMLGLRPALGRFFGPEDQSPVVVLGHASWMRWFGGDPAIVGRTIRIKRDVTVNVTVLGVLPAEFRDLGPNGDRDFWFPPATFAALDNGDWREFGDWRNTYFNGIARLRPGIGPAQLQAELSAIGTGLAQAHPETNARRRLAGMTDLDWRLHRAGATGWALLAMVMLVVAISCVNVANLLLARVEARRKEIATRAALGASRARLARQLLTESVLVGCAGTACGLLVAVWIIAAVPALIGLPPEARQYITLRLDLRDFWTTGSIALGTALLFGLAPPIAGSRTDLAPALRSAPPARFRRFPLRAWLAVSQLALTLVLLTATVLCGTSFWNARHGNIGISHDRMLSVWTSNVSARQARPALDRLRSLHQVSDAAIAFRVPLSPNGGGMAMSVKLPGHAEFSASQPPIVVKCNSVDGRYFSILGIRLLSGRVFDGGDTENAPPVAVISQAMARRFWPAADPVGKFIRAFPEARDYRIVGVVADAPINEIGEVPEPYIYTSWWQNHIGEYTLLAKTAGDAASLAPTVRACLMDLDPRFKQSNLNTMDEIVGDATMTYRATAQLVASLAVLGLLLAAVGFYGVIAYGVALRTREIGIRMAIGARHTDAASLVVRQALTFALAGIAVGLPCSIAAARALRAILFGISPWSLPALLAGCAGMIVVALAAAWIPAIRAARIDPLVALRCD